MLDYCSCQRIVMVLSRDLLPPFAAVLMNGGIPIPYTTMHAQWVTMFIALLV